ncbi:hypothetical protein HWV62_32684 [Athelia sp. TMB]|nr:hypothetical protein HWV62_32684 [Athelia sp. TMB]
MGDAFEPERHRAQELEVISRLHSHSFPATSIPSPVLAIGEHFMSYNPAEIGTLIAVILKAKNLPNKRHIGKQDPYCAVSLNGEKRRTKAVKRGGQHPEWDEEVRFQLLEEEEDVSKQVAAGEAPPPLPPKNGKGPRNIKGGNSMKIQCFADDPREPELIGETMVDLTEALTKGETDEWFTLMHKDKYCGEVYLELTFWSNEAPPEKKSKPKPSKFNKQYSGPGTFVPSGDLPPSLMSGPGSRSSRMSSNGPNDSIPSSLRSSISSATADLYTPPYEQRNRLSPVDQMANDFGQLNVADHRRRESFPPVQGHVSRHSNSFGSSIMPLNGSLPVNGHGFEHSAYADLGSQFNYGTPATPTQTQPGYGGQPPYQSQYEPSPPQTNYALPARQNSGPRYSLPSASSGFMPIPQPSGFMSHSPDLSGYISPPPATPGPMSYGNASVPQSSFPPPPTPTPGPSGFMPPMHSQTPVPSSFMPPQTPLPSGFMQPMQPPHQQSTPSPYQGQQYPPQTQPQFQQQYQPYEYAPQPPLSAPPGQYAPQPPQSTPPQQYLPPQLAAAAPTQSQSTPPQGYGYGHGTSSPPQNFIPPPPPPPLPTPPGQNTGSRPLPLQPQYPQQVQQQPNLPVPPQSYSPNHQNGLSFSPSNGYNLVPPPPPPPLVQTQGGHERTVSQSFQPPRSPIPPPPPPPQLHSSSPSGRPSLPQPPVQQQQQHVYQTVPPPPPPPPPLDFAQHQHSPPPPPHLHDGSQSYYQPPQSQWMHQMADGNWTSA